MFYNRASEWASFEMDVVTYDQDGFKQSDKKQASNQLNTTHKKML